MTLPNIPEHPLMLWMFRTGVGVSVWLLLLFAAALLGVFTLVSVMITGIAAAWFSTMIIRYVERHGALQGDGIRLPVAALCIIIAVAVFTVIFHHDVPRGRDDAIYVSSASLLHHYHALRIDDPYAAFIGGMIQSPGGGYTPQFFPGYPLYLGGWEVLAGRFGIAIGDAFLVLGGLMAIALTAVVIARRSTGVVVTLLLATSYVFQWFPRRTTSENLFFFLFWTGVLFLLYGITRKRYALALIALFPLSVLSFVRLEGILYLAVAAAVLIGAGWHRQYLVAGTAARAVLCGAAVFIGIIGTMLSYYLIRVNSTYTVSITGRFLTSLNEARWAVFAVVLAAAAVMLRRQRRSARIRAVGTSIARRMYLWTMIVLLILFVIVLQQFVSAPTAVVIQIYTVLVLSVFAILPMYLVVFLPVRRDGIRLLGIVGILCIPAILLFINPQIRFDLPWFLRRFYPVFIPFSALVCAVFLTSTPRRLLRSVFLASILFVQLTLSLPLIGYQDHRGAYTALAAFAQRYSSDDLLIMAPNTRGYRWGIALHYLFGLHIVVATSYSDDTEPLTALIQNHANVYLITNDPHQPPRYPSQRFTREAPYAFSIPELTPTNESLFTKLQSRSSVSLTILEPSLSHRIVPKTQSFIQEQWYIYRLEDPMILLQTAQSGGENTVETDQ